MRAHARRTVRAMLPLALVLTVATAALAARPAPASALTAVSCVGTSHLSYSPGLTNTPQSVTITIRKNFPLCLINVLTPDSAAVPDRSVTVTRSCSDLLLSGTGTDSLLWGSGGRSDLSYANTSTYVDGQLVVTQTGAVAAGRYAGAAMVGTLTYLGDLTACGRTGGLTSLDGVYLLRLLAA